MLTKTTPIFITQYIGTADQAKLELVIDALVAELDKVKAVDRASAQIAGLNGLAMSYVRTLNAGEEAVERHAQALAGIKALRDVPPENVSAAIEALLLQLDRTEI